MTAIVWAMAASRISSRRPQRPQQRSRRRPWIQKKRKWWQPSVVLLHCCWSVVFVRTAWIKSNKFQLLISKTYTQYFLLYYKSTNIIPKRNFDLRTKKVCNRAYPKLSIKHPVLLNDLVWIFPKSLYETTRSISEKFDRTVLFQSCHDQFLDSIKRLGLDIWINSLLNNQYYLFFKF